MVISIPDEGSTGYRHRGNDKWMTEHKVTAVDTAIPTLLFLLLFCVTGTLVRGTPSVALLNYLNT